MSILLKRVLPVIFSLVAALPANAQTSGLLLGLHVSAPDTGQFRGDWYATYWIAPQNGVVRILSSDRDLVVPRRSGFWAVCANESSKVDAGELLMDDTVVVRPVHSPRPPCGRRLKKPSRGEVRCETTGETRILFVGPDAVSTERRDESDCGAHPSGSTTVMLTNPDDGRIIDYSTLFDRAGRKTLKSSTLEAAQKAFADFGDIDTAEMDATDGKPVPHLRIKGDWAIERGYGRWQTIGQATCSPYVSCGDVGQRFVVENVRPPTKLVGHDELYPSMDVIKAAVPDAKDAVSSPRRDLVAVLTADSLLVFVPKKGKLGEPVARTAVDGQIVMAQWAVGRFVPIWTKKLKEILY